MGGAIQYVYRDGSRLTPWMLYCVNRFSEAMYSAFGERILVTSGIRTYEEQKRIFLMRYVRHGDIRGRKVYDTRWWNGYLWYRIDPVGTVRQPGLSNHEIQGSTAAVDLRDTGKDAGISKFNNPRSNWARANAWRYGLSPEGYNFKEPWHYAVPDIFRTPPATPAGGNSKPVPKPEPAPETPEEEDDMSINTMYHTTDPKFKYRIAVTNDTSGLWIEYVSNDSGINNKLATQYKTGGAIEVSNSLFAALRDSAQSVRPQGHIKVTTGEA